MKMGTRIMVGVGIGCVLALLVGVVAFAVAPPFQFPDQWAWLNEWGRLGVAAGAAMATFGLAWFFTVLSIAVSMFNDFGEMNP